MFVRTVASRVVRPRSVRCTQVRNLGYRYKMANLKLQGFVPWFEWKLCIPVLIPSVLCMILCDEQPRHGLPTEEQFRDVWHYDPVCAHDMTKYHIRGDHGSHEAHH
eukprot:UN03963